MASNGAGRKAPAPASTSFPNLVDPSVVDDMFTEKEKKPGTVKLKKANPKQTKRGNWAEDEVEGFKKSDPSSSSRAQSPLVKSLDAKAAAAFPTGRPLEDQPDLVQCKHCKKPILRTVAAAHVRGCLDKKQEKLKKKKEAKEAKEAAARKERDRDNDRGKKSETPNEDDADTIDSKKPKSAKKSALADADGAKKGRKRKADGDAGDKEPKKKKKKDGPKIKVPKPKPPVDVERQCGVELKEGAMCARSLTCKSHSMGAKRAVPGRSLPYDTLLANYQKTNQAKLQRAILAANAPLADDSDDGAHGPIDADEEKDDVMAALSRWHPRPLATKTFLATKSKYQYIRMKSELQAALSGSRGGGLFAAALAAAAAAAADGRGATSTIGDGAAATGEAAFGTESRRGSGTVGAPQRPLHANQQRKGSMTGAVMLSA
ncbi:SCA7, zinc-binding domain-containing protein [Cryomyces antarcticus]